MTQLVEVRDLHIHFPTEDGLVKAVDGLSFGMGSGHTPGILGESGSGKSVTSLGILGLHEGTSTRISGEIWLDGEDLVRTAPERIRELRGNKVAMILQDRCPRSTPRRPGRPACAHSPTRPSVQGESGESLVAGTSAGPPRRDRDPSGSRHRWLHHNPRRSRGRSFEVRLRGPWVQLRACPAASRSTVKPGGAHDPHAIAVFTFPQSDGTYVIGICTRDDTGGQAQVLLDGVLVTCARQDGAAPERMPSSARGPRRSAGPGMLEAVKRHGWVHVHATDPVRISRPGRLGLPGSHRCHGWRAELHLCGVRRAHRLAGSPAPCTGSASSRVTGLPPSASTVTS